MESIQSIEISHPTNVEEDKLSSNSESSKEINEEMRSGAGKVSHLLMFILETASRVLQTHVQKRPKKNKAKERPL